MGEVIDKQIEGFDLPAFFDSLAMTYRHVNEELKLDCPFCTDTRGRFYINERSKAYYCHNCGVKGNLRHFLGRLLDLTDSQVEDRIKRQPLREPGPPLAPAADEVAIDLPPGYQRLDFPPSKLSRPYWGYVVDTRDLAPSEVLRYRIGHCRAGRYTGRVVVPVYWQGTLVNWIARAISSKRSPKVLTPRANQQSKYLFNLDRLWGQESLVLTEGVFDALRLPSMAVCSFGKRLSDAQCALLASSGARRLTIAYDADALDEAREVAKRLCDHLRVFIVTDFPEGTDPGSLSEATMYGHVQRAQPYHRRASRGISREVKVS